MKQTIKHFQLILFLLIISFLSVNAQNFQLDWGAEIPRKKRTQGFNASQNFYHILNRRKDQCETLQFDFNHNLIGTTALSSKFKNVNMKYWKALSLKSGEYQIFNYIDEKEKKIQLYAAKIDEQGKWYSNKEKIVAFNYEKKNFVFGELGSNKDKIGIVVSRDSSKVLITSVKNPRDYGKIKGREIYSLAVFNDKMELLWSKDIEFPQSDNNIIIRQFELTNAGEVVLTILSREKKSLLTYKNQKIRICVIAENKDDVEINIQFKDPDIFELFMQLSESQEIEVFAFYRKSKEKEGVLLIRYDKEGKELFRKLNDLEQTFVDELKREKKLFKNKGKPQLFIDKVIYEESSESYLIIVENRGRIKKRTYDDTGPIYTYTYYSDEILVLSMTRDGAINWITPIEKDFMTSPSGRKEISYFMTYKNKYLFFVFNDEKELKERRKVQRKGNLTGTFTELVKLDAFGEIAFRELLFTSKENVGFFKPEQCQLTKNKDILFFFNYGLKKYRVGLLSLN